MDDVVCVAQTTVDWKVLLIAAQQALGRSISTSIDVRDIPAQGLVPFLACLSDFKTPGPHDVILSLRRNKSAWKHVILTFLFHSQNVSALVELNSVSIIVSGNSLIGTGSLADWQHFCLAGLTRESTVRFVVGKLFGLLERLGYGFIFSDVKRMDAGDGTFFLENK